MGTQKVTMSAVPSRRRRVAWLALMLAGASSLTIARANAQAARLDEIAVEGQNAAPRGVDSSGAGRTAGTVGRGGPGGRVTREDPKGPIDGYVATRSSTATKTNTPLLETPQSVTVIGQEQIQAQGATTLTQATQYAAGIYSGVTGVDQRVDFFNLRGFRASDYGIYKDGLQLLNYGFGTLQTEIFGLERIEVLRGPAAVLFGAGNPGGLVNQITKRPTLQPFGYAEVGGGSFGQVYGAVDLGGPIGDTGQWFYRLTSIGRTGGTQVDGADSDRAYIAPAITYRPDAGTTFTVLTSYQRDSSAVTAAFLPYYGSVRPNVSGLRIDRSLNVGDPNINSFQREQVFAGYEFEHAVDETWTVRQNLRYSFSAATQNSYQAGNVNPFNYADAAQTQLNRFQFAFRDKVSLFQVDNQAEAQFSDGLFLHDVIFGVDYKNYKLNDNQLGNFTPFYAVPPINIVNPNYIGSVGTPNPYLIDVPRFSQVGLYFQDQIKLTERLSLIGGLRQDFAATDVKVNLDAFGFTKPTRRDDQALTGRIALLYNFDPGIAPYVAYSTSFQPQIGFDGMTGGALIPNRGEQIEVGLKLQPIGERYSLTLAAFDLVQDNPIIPIATPPFGSTQQGSVRSRGVEAQFVASLAEGLNVVANVTHYDLEYIKGQTVLLGKTPIGIPETFASAFLDYTVPVGDYRGFGLGGGVRYVGSSFADNANTLKVPEYVLFDATIHYTWDAHWRAGITASNIGDRRFVTSCVSDVACFYGEARRVIGSVSYKW